MLVALHRHLSGHADNPVREIDVKEAAVTSENVAGASATERT
jgi:hypothetical protein